jgi:hypothetical protein
MHGFKLNWVMTALFAASAPMMMAAHTGTATYTGTRYYISATLPDTYDAAGYQSTDIVWSEITKISDFPAYGSKRAVGKFNPINGAIDKYVGSPDYGSGNLMCADLPSDAGQVILKAAGDNPNVHYSIKVVATDGEIDFLDVIVAGWEKAQAKENTPQTRTCAIEVCKAPVNVAAT